MKYIKQYEYENKKYWSISFQDPYFVYKISKIIKDSNKKYAVLTYKSNHPDENRILYISPEELNIWNFITFQKNKFYDLHYQGEIELTPEEKEMADIEIDAKKYNL